MLNSSLFYKLEKVKLFFCFINICLDSLIALNFICLSCYQNVNRRNLTESITHLLKVPSEAFDLASYLSFKIHRFPFTNELLLTLLNFLTTCPLLYDEVMTGIDEAVREQCKRRSLRFSSGERQNREVAGDVVIGDHLHNFPARQMIN